MRSPLVPFKRKDTPEKKRLMVKLWATSLLSWEIAVAIKVHDLTLNKWRKELGLPSRRKSCGS